MAGHYGPVDLSAEAFYDELAGEYHLLFPAELDLVCDAEGAALEPLLPAPPARVLDVSCGIGTQAIGLAARGYEVVGRDLSPRAVDRARAEADRRGLALDLAVADMREVHRAVEGRFDAVITCDNSLAHLPSAGDLGAALHAARRVLRDGGTFVATVRDYDELAAIRATGVPGTLPGDEGERAIVAQAWEWSPDGETVRIRHVVLRETPDGWRTAVRITTMRAWRRAELTAALADAGFGPIEWRDPDDAGWYQPVVTARVS